jgi:hypothetical protein
VRDRFKDNPVYFCPPPPTRGLGPDESKLDKVRSALAGEYSKTLHYCIGHLRRADGGLRPKKEGSVCSMDLLAGWDAIRFVTRCMLRLPTRILHSIPFL